MFWDEKNSVTKWQSRGEPIDFMPTLRSFVTVLLFLIPVFVGRLLICYNFFLWAWRDVDPSSMAKKASESGSVGLWCVIKKFAHIIFWHYNTHFFLTLEWNRGGKGNEKCSTQSCDLALLHNLVMEAFAKPDDHINNYFDFWDAACHPMVSFLKYCKDYEKEFATSHRSLWLSHHRREWRPSNHNEG